MKIAVIGTGMVGRAIAGRLKGLGHDVVIGTREPAKTLARTQPDGKGTPPFSQWYRDHPDIRVLTMPDAGSYGELVVNATGVASSLAALEHVGKENLANKILLDITLPLDMSEGMPPRLFIVNDNSLGEEIQKRFPRTRVVKSLNTVQCEVMVRPAIIPGRHNIFVSGNDFDAKAIISNILKDFGWTEDVIIDLGDITTCRAVEMYSRLLFTVAEYYGDYFSNISIIRRST